MKASELRQKNEEELSRLLQERMAKLAELKFDLAGAKVKNIKEIRSIKLDRARILTLQKEAKESAKLKAQSVK